MVTMRDHVKDTDVVPSVTRKENRLEEEEVEEVIRGKMEAGREPGV